MVVGYPFLLWTHQSSKVALKIILSWNICSKFSKASCLVLVAKILLKTTRCIELSLYTPLSENISKHGWNSSWNLKPALNSGYILSIGTE